MLKCLGVSGGLAAVALLALAMPALAGGWAVTSLDALPSEFRAGQTYRLGYTIRQHGVTPFTGARTRILTEVPATGETTAFAGAPEGAPGHYVAEVRFPSAGMWTWHVEQGPFGLQSLGTVTVLAAPALTGGPAGALIAVPPAASTRGTDIQHTELGGLRLLLPMATVLASALFAWRLLLFVRRTQPAMTVPASRVARLPG